MPRPIALATLLFCLAGCASNIPGPDRVMGADSASFQAPIELIPTALGRYTWPITTANPEAQRYFDQGMQLRYAYNVNEAARSFAEARRQDPACAMCYWGEAFALGSFLNGAMSAEKAPFAHAAIELAARHMASATPVERDLITAARVRYPADYDPSGRRAVDETFASAMAEVYEKHPRHHEVAVVYAVSLFMLEDRLGYRDLADPDLIRLHRVLTGVLDETLEHPGACHLYIHATESTPQPGLALPCAEYLSGVIPVASHIQHMPSHTWNEMGLWGKSVRANMNARKSDSKAVQGQGFSYGGAHNLHMLLFAASYDGQGAVATQAGKDYRKVTGNAQYEVLTLVRFGRFDEVLANTNRPTEASGAALWDFAQGIANVRQGSIAEARRLRDGCLEFAATTDARFGFQLASAVVGTAAHILDGEVARHENRTDDAIAAFRRAAEVEDTLDYSEPEPLPFAARHWLGAALLEAGRAAEAETAYRVELGDHPHDVWSLHGLHAALAAQGKVDADVEADFEASTSRMDIWLTASRL